MRARAARDVFAAAGIHGIYQCECACHESDLDAPRPEPCAQSAMQRPCVAVSISWSARSAARHNSQRSPGRANSKTIVTIVVMGAKTTRPTAPEGSAKGHTRREPGWCGSRRQLQGHKKKGRLCTGPGGTRPKTRGWEAFPARVVMNTTPTGSPPAKSNAVHTRRFREGKSSQ